MTWFDWVVLVVFLIYVGYRLITGPNVNRRRRG